MIFVTNIGRCVPHDHGTDGSILPSDLTIIIGLHLRRQDVHLVPAGVRTSA